MDTAGGKSGSECSGSQACLSVPDLVSNETGFKWDEFRRAELPSLPIVVGAPILSVPPLSNGKPSSLPSNDGAGVSERSVPWKMSDGPPPRATGPDMRTTSIEQDTANGSTEARSNNDKPNNDLFEPQPKSPPPEVDPNRTDSSLLPSQLTPMFPGSENLPWTGEGIINGFFNHRFSFNSNSFTYNNPQDGNGHSQSPLREGDSENGISGWAQMRSSPSPPAPKPYSGPVKQDKHSFPESGGHRLGTADNSTTKSLPASTPMQFTNQPPTGSLQPQPTSAESASVGTASPSPPMWRRDRTIPHPLIARIEQRNKTASLQQQQQTDGKSVSTSGPTSVNTASKGSGIPNTSRLLSQSTTNALSASVPKSAVLSTLSTRSSTTQSLQDSTPLSAGPLNPVTIIYSREHSLLSSRYTNTHKTLWKKGGKTESDIASNIYLSDDLQLMHFDQPKVQATSEATDGNPNHHPVSSNTDKSQTISPKKHIYTSNSDQKNGKMPGVSIKQEVPHQTDNKQKQLQTVPGTETPSTSLMKPEPSKPTSLQPQNRSQPRSLPMQLPNYHDRAALLAMCMIGNDWPGVDTIINSMQLLGEELESDEGKTAFHYVCRDGNIGRIRRMIAKGAKVTHIDKSGQSVLHYNAVLTNEQLLKILLIDFRNKRVSVDVTNKESYWTPLMMVCTIGDAAYGSAKLLLEFGANPNGNPKAQSTPLIVACQSTHNTCQLVELLVGHGADINKQDKDGYTLLLKACNSRKWNVAQFILELSHLTTINRSDRAGTTPLFEAVLQNSPEMVELLLTKGARTSDLQPNNVPSIGSRSVEETPFAHACRHGMLQIVKLLVKYKADVNYKCLSSVPALAFAVVNHKNHIVQYLLHECKQLDTSIYGLRTPITYSVKYKNDQCTKWMLDKLGGVQKAAQEAEKIGMTDLFQDIEQYRISSQTASYEQVSTYQSHETVDTGLTAHSDQIEEVLYQFSKICLMVLKDRIGLSELASAASANNPSVPEIGHFFQRYARGFQDERSLKVDFLGPHKDVSPLSYVIQQRCISRQAFMHHAEVYFKGSLGAQKFVGKLVHTFHSISRDTQSVPWNGDTVLDRLFSGEFSLSSSRYPLPAAGRRIPPPEEDQRHYEAYQQALHTGLSIALKYIKLLIVGPPRSGKTSLKRRLVGDIINLTDQAIYPSTGAVDAQNVVVKLAEEKINSSTAVISEYTWTTVGKDKGQGDLDEELLLLYQFIAQSSQNIAKTTDTDTDSGHRTGGSGNDTVPELADTHKDQHEVSPGKVKSDQEIESAFKAFNNTLKSYAGQQQLKVLLEKTILLNMIDTGGQPAFIEMLPMLTIGPALYLIFLRLDQELKQRYKIQYVSEDEEEMSLGESSYTLQEVIFQVLSSIACCRSDTSSATSLPEKQQITSHQSQVAMLVGTYKDKLAGSPDEVKSKIKQTDKALRDDLKEILDTDPLEANRDLLRYAEPSDSQLMFDVDNMTGSEDEVMKIQKRLGEVILQEFNKLPIPASWLMFDIFLRRMGKHTISLSQCEEIGRRLQVSDVREAIWFLHHCIGVLMHYPDVEELKDKVICDPQIVFDSVTELILNTFEFKRIRKSACDKFKQAGQFSFNDIEKLSKNLKSGILPLPQLVKLLEHLNIIAPISFPEESGAALTESPQSASLQGVCNESVVYFMPAVLPSAQEHELNVSHSPADPAPLLIRFKSGIIPVGVFCASVASIVAHKDQLRWTLMEPRSGTQGGYSLHKNRVIFRVNRYNGSYDVTLISKPKQYEVHIQTICTPSGSPSHKICQHVLETICHTLNHVISKMKHKQYLTLLSSDRPNKSPYELGFQCPKHPQEDHMAVCRPYSEPILSTADQWFGYFKNNTSLLCINEDRVVYLTFPQTHDTSANFSDSLRQKEGFQNSHDVGGVRIDKKYGLWMGPPKLGNSFTNSDGQRSRTSEVIDEKDWPTICGYLRKMDRPQIQQLGGELGLDLYILEKMKDLPYDMVRAWLRKQDHVKEKSGDPLTWKALVVALQSIGQQGIADDIFKDMCGNLGNRLHCLTMRRPGEEQTTFFSRSGNSKYGVLH